jgi:2-dehydro-3-deoxygluconokinase
VIEPHHDLASPAEPPAVACIGEALVLLGVQDARNTQDARDPLPGPSALAGELPAGAQLAGAEANVAVGLARMGVRSAWVGRLGADAYGDFLRRELEHRGVVTDAVQVDPGRPTGYYDKIVVRAEDGSVRSEMRYRRAGSAASAMDTRFLAAEPVAGALSGARLVHTSGITAALSPSCAAMMRELLGRPRPAGRLVSFDLNWREQLWPDGDPATVVELADLADIVLAGTDEAERVFGTAEPAALRQQLPGPVTLLLKDGARRAMVVDRAGASQAVPALTVEVVEPIGAGDAFAAGYLAGVVRGDDPVRCLRRGHLSAAAVLTVAADTAALPADDLVDALLDCSAADWAQTSVGAAGFAGPAVTA